MEKEELKSYVFMLQGDYKNWHNLSPEDNQKICSDIGTWVQKLQKEGRFDNGSALKDGSFKVRKMGADNYIVDGPFAELKEALTGFFEIKAKDKSEAFELAKELRAISGEEDVLVFETGH